MSCRSDFKSVLIDASEQPVERPKKRADSITAEIKNVSLKKFKLKQEEFFILIFAMEKCMISDFFKKVKLLCSLMFLFLLMPDIREFQKFTKTTELHLKGKIAVALSEEEKKENRELSKQRIRVEHIFRKLKIFRILREKYRNRRKRFCLRFNLIAACCNLAVRSA